AFEKGKIRGAIRTDFVLSAEIIAIALGSVAGQTLVTQAGVLVVVALVMTVGVYGAVAAIVKMDDAGLVLSRRQSRAAQRLGALLMSAAPPLMRLLTVLGTAAMFLVGGGILVHGVPPLHHAIAAAGAWPGIGWAAEMLANALIGVAAGALVLGGVTLVQRLSGKH